MSSSPPLPVGMTARSDADDVGDDVESVRGTTVADRARILESLCRMAAEQVAQHADPRRALDWQDPVSPETDALMARLRKRQACG